MSNLSPEDAERELSADVYERVFYSIQNPALVIDLNFTIRDANHAAVEFLEYERREDLVGTPVETILANASILENVATQIQQNQYWTGETEIMTANERVRLGLGTAVPIDVEGQQPLIAGVFTDLTERRRYTSSLKVLNRVFRHNIRNDASVIWGTLEQMALAIDDEKLQKSLERAEEKLMGIIDNADTARELELLLHRDTDPSAKTIRLDEVLADKLADAESTYPHARFDYPDELPAVTVVADESINRILTQVIENAVTHNDKETPRVHVSLSQSEKTVLLSIADNGPGVPPEHRDMIFGREEISQIDHGSGFSLFFVDQVMDLYGGDVWIDDSDFGGAVCNLQFPRPH